MVTIQRYFLYVLMFTSLCSSAMEHVTFERIDVKEDVDIKQFEFDCAVKSIAAKIDKDYLGIGACECGHLKSLLGSIISFIKPCCLTYREIANEVKKIEKIIPSNVDKKEALQRLIKDHLYVKYLMRYLVSQKVKELEDVTGSTIDRLYNDSLNKNKSDVIKSIVCEDAFNIFLADSDERPDLLNLSGDIHVTTLLSPHDGDLQPQSLAMSTDGKYVRATDENLVALDQQTQTYKNARLIWDMKTGKNVTPQDAESIEWTKANKWELKTSFSGVPFGTYYDIMDENNCYYAMTSHNGRYFPVDGVRRKGIILRKMPQTESYLCQQAVENSGSLPELNALKDSQIVKKLEESFVKDNLHTFIEDKRTLLTENMAHKRFSAPLYAETKKNL